MRVLPEARENTSLAGTSEQTRIRTENVKLLSREDLERAQAASTNSQESQHPSTQAAYGVLCSPSEVGMHCARAWRSLESRALRVPTIYCSRDFQQSLDEIELGSAVHRISFRLQ